MASVFALSFGAIGSAAANGPDAGTAALPTSADDLAVDVTPTSLEMDLFALTNADRVNAGLPPVTFDVALLGVARERGAEQRTDTALNHYDASGELAFVGLIQTTNIAYTRAGENLARVSAPQDSAAQRAETALMASPTHRANILQPDFDHLAIGEVVDPSGRIVFAEIFRASE